MIEINGIVLLNGGVGKSVPYKNKVSTGWELEELRKKLKKEYDNKYQVLFETRVHPDIKGHWV